MEKGMMPFSKKKCRYFKGETDTFKIYKPFGLINMYVDCNIVAHVLANDNKP